MKINKGEPGYISAQKKKLVVQTCVSFAIVLALVILGYIVTGTKLNWLTVIAILGCLPAAKIMVGAIMICRHHSVKPEIAEDLEKKAPHLVKAYDTVVTSYEKIMPIAAMVITEHTICGYTYKEDLDMSYTATHIRRMLNKNGFYDVSVKIFTEYKGFAARAEGLNSMAAVSGNANLEREEEMKNVILNISL